MADRPLNLEEAELWRRVVERVRPIAPHAVARPAVAKATASPAVVRKVVTTAAAPVAAPRQRRILVDATLDGSWDRQLTRGAVMPDATIDLHGHTLDTAYARVDAALEQAALSGARVLLLITGKARERTDGTANGRGAIRAVVTDWLAASRHSARIAAVRGAHPRHGGAGALYVILRRIQAGGGWS